MTWSWLVDFAAEFRRQGDAAGLVVAAVGLPLCLLAWAIDRWRSRSRPRGDAPVRVRGWWGGE